MSSKQISPDKERQNNLKIYLAALTSRKCANLYANVLDKTYILTNLQPDKFVKHCDASTAVHFLTINNRSVTKSIRELYDVLDIGKASYVIKIGSLLSVLNKCKFSLEDLPKIHRDKNGIIFYFKEAKGGKTTVKEVLAFPNQFYKVILFLENLYDTLVNILDRKDIQEDVIFKEFDLMDYEEEAGIVHIDIDPMDYKHKDGTPHFKEPKENKFLSLDIFSGLEVVSLKEFIKKYVNKSKAVCKFLTWAIYGHIEYLSYFKDENIRVISTRPYNRVYLKQNKKRKKND